jgi:FdhD protein
MARGRTQRLLARPLGEGRAGRAPEEVLVEEPLEIRLGDDIVATTMRTPGHDFELAVGLMWSEGRLAGRPEEVRYCATGSAVDTGFNVVTVAPSAGSPGGGETVQPPPRLGLTSSSCGVCGSAQIEQLVERLSPLPSAGPLDAAVLTSVGAGPSGGQELFAATGGSHAAAVLDDRGRVLSVREDIGRHNAVDKVVGRLVLDGELPDPASATRRRLLWVSGRASFEIVQKAWAAGFSALLAVGAASALAVSTAQSAGLVLVGFARDGRATLYAGDAAVDRDAAVDGGPAPAAPGGR